MSIPPSFPRRLQFFTAIHPLLLFNQLPLVVHPFLRAVHTRLRGVHPLLLLNHLILDVNLVLLLVRVLELLHTLPLAVTANSTQARVLVLVLQVSLL